jgi:hypothetical protein
MKGDFSRQTFRKGKRYSGVLMQQGRVQLDADANEQQAIQRHHAETTATDVIGATGAPKQGGGFQVGLTPDTHSLTLSAGRFYVDGILCEQAATEVPIQLVSATPAVVTVPSLMLDGWAIAAGQLLELVADDRASVAVTVTAVDVGQRRLTLSPNVTTFQTATAVRIRRRPTLHTQPDFFAPPNVTGNGRYLVYLEAWQRHITALEDPEIRESALGGPDTTTRTKTVWQVKLLKVANTATCSMLGTSWIPDLGVLRGQLIASTTPATSATGPCVLPPTAGYHRLENQLYRVEVHQGGPRASARFKWSRDNGSVAASIESLSGTTVTIVSGGRDALSEFDQEHWVEVADDRTDLNDQHGRLAKVDRIDPAQRQIRLVATASPLPTYGAADQPFHPKLRRWDQPETVGNETGIGMGAKVELEGGVSVEFTDGQYHAGDYWLIPARTGKGDIEWPRDDAGSFLPQPPAGVTRHYAALALVDLTGTNFALVPGSADCRLPFPPLTAITASDVSFDNTTCQLDSARTVQQAIDLLCQRSSGLCTATAFPGPGWESVFNLIPDNQHGQICFPVGLYPLNGPVTVRNKGRLTLSGVGSGSQLTISGRETVLLFQNCAEVQVRDMAIATTALVSRDTAEHLNGTLTFDSCGPVTIERVTLSGAAGPRRTAACLTVRNPTARPDTPVRVRQSTLNIGHEQIGILLVNVSRAEVEDNILRAIPRPATLDLPHLLEDPEYRARVRSLLISNTRFGNQIPRGPATNDRIDVREQPVVFTTDPTLIGQWARIARIEVPNGFSTPQQAILYLRGLADRVLLGRGAGIDVFTTWFNGLNRELVNVAAQGIVVAGVAAPEVRIVNNSLGDVLEAIHVGVSHTTVRPTPSGSIDSAGVVTIDGNTAAINLTALSGRERYGIFVGNCSRLLIENNTVTVRRPGRMVTPPMDGIRVYGVLGRMMVIRQNHLSGFPLGVRVLPLRAVQGQANLWAVTDNVMPQALLKVDAPASVRTRAQAANTDTNFS